MNKRLLAALISTGVVLGAQSVCKADELENPIHENDIKLDRSEQPPITFENLTKGVELADEGSFEAEGYNEEETINNNQEARTPADVENKVGFTEITENSDIEPTNVDEEAITDKVVIDLEKIGVNPYPWRNDGNIDFDDDAIKDGTLVEITDGNIKRVFDLKKSDKTAIKKFKEKLNEDDIEINIRVAKEGTKKNYYVSIAIEDPEDETTANRKLTITQLFNPSLKVEDQDGNILDLNAKAMVYWDANTAEAFDLKNGELKYSDRGKNSNTNKKYRNNEGKIYYDGRPLGVGSIVKDGDSKYEVSNFSSDAVNGTIIQFKKYDDIELISLKPAEDATTVDYKFEYTDFETERIANPDLNYGEHRIIQVGSSGYTLYKIVLDGNGEEISREKVAERLAQNQIVEYGTKEVKEECEWLLIPLTPAKKVEEEKTDIVLTPLSSAKDFEDRKDNEMPLISLIPASPIDDDKSLPTDDNKATSDHKEDGKTNGKIVDNKDNKDQDSKEVKVNKASDKNKKDEADEAPLIAKGVLNKEVKGQTRKSSNPKTGVASLSTVLATLMASVTGVFASKKRK